MAQNPGYWQEGDRKWYYQKASSGAGPWYFFPVKKLKNGGLSGLMVDESMDRKAKKRTVSRVEFRDWKQVPESDVPAKVRSTVFSDGWAKKATDGQLRKSLIRLAAQRKDLRPHLLPLLASESRPHRGKRAGTGQSKTAGYEEDLAKNVAEALKFIDRLVALAGKAKRELKSKKEPGRDMSEFVGVLIRGVDEDWYSYFYR